VAMRIDVHYTAALRTGGGVGSPGGIITAARHGHGEHQYSRPAEKTGHWVSG
jgi:hypothetical protein